MINSLPQSNGVLRQRPCKFWPNKFQRKKIKADNRYWVELQHLHTRGGILISEKHQMKAAASWLAVSLISPPAILFSGINDRNILTIKSTTNIR